MVFKYYILLIFNLILLQNGKCDNNDLNDINIHLFLQIEDVKRSVEILEARLDILSERPPCVNDKKFCHESAIENPQRTVKPIFDIRFDDLPKHCATEYVPSSCAEATKCTRSSGIYNITDTQYSNKTFTVYCDYNNYGGDWMYVLKIVDGTENFNRPWNDYVNGFGNVGGEYWIGLENLYALTNFYGPQELNVHLENFEGRKAYARYDNFVVGNAKEKYELKSLGSYSGTAGDSLYNKVGFNFSTYDNENSNSNCAKLRKGGFWFNNCKMSNPTGPYLRGSYDSNSEGSYWKTFEGVYYSPKTIIFMIRRQSAMILQ